MILWTGKPKREEVETVSGCGRRSWRWVFEIDWPGRPRIGFVRQVLFDGPTYSRNWRPGAGYYRAYLRRRFLVGIHHDYYDGPHCQVSIGWISFAWQPDYCPKCQEGM